MMRRVLCGFAAFVAVLGLATGSWAADFTFRLAHTHNEKGQYYKGAMEFKKLVEQRSGGKIAIEHFPGGQLGADRDIQEGVRMGTIQSGLSSSPVVLLDEYFKLLDAPYLFVDRDHVARALDGPLGQTLAKPLEEKGIKHLGYWENGFRQITNNKRPIVKPDDLKGIKLRTPESSVRMQTFKTFGANPVPMPFTELFGALQQGIVDGQENPLLTSYQASFFEVQKYLSITNHVYSAVHLLVNKKLFDSMPADLQKVMVDAGREIAVFTRKLGEEGDKTLADEFKKKGVQVNTADIKSFVPMSKPIWETIAKGVKLPNAPALLEEIAKLSK
jgi:tripartite ATP-independent transporter DctP family solute receptor